MLPCSSLQAKVPVLVRGVLGASGRQVNPRAASFFLGKPIYCYPHSCRAVNSGRSSADDDSTRFTGAGAGGISSASPPSSTSSIRLSKLLSQFATNLAISRNAAETLIKDGSVSVAGKVVYSPHMLVDLDEIGQSGSVVIKVQGKGIQLDLASEISRNTGSAKARVPAVYAVHKLPGEVVTENDPQNRPSMIKRLMQGGVGMRRVGTKLQQMHLKPIGRLDIPTEGLCLVTNDGEFAREMELPENQVHRVYRARVHGRLTSAKLNRIRSGGVRFNDVRYGPMKVAVEKTRRSKQRDSLYSSPTNTWVQITSTEGKNRQIRNVFEALGGK